MYRCDKLIKTYIMRYLTAILLFSLIMSCRFQKIEKYKDFASVVSQLENIHEMSSPNTYKGVINGVVYSNKSENEIDAILREIEVSYADFDDLKKKMIENSIAKFFYFDNKVFLITGGGFGDRNGHLVQLDNSVLESQYRLDNYDVFIGKKLQEGVYYISN